MCLAGPLVLAGLGYLCYPRRLSGALRGRRCECRQPALTLAPYLGCVCCVGQVILGLLKTKRGLLATFVGAFTHWSVDPSWPWRGIEPASLPHYTGARHQMSYTACSGALVSAPRLASMSRASWSRVVRWQDLHLRPSPFSKTCSTAELQRSIRLVFLIAIQFLCPRNCCWSGLWVSGCFWAVLPTAATIPLLGIKKDLHMV